jgi:hypothetical protein
MSLDRHAPHELAALGHEPIEADVRAVWRTAAVITGVVLAAFMLIAGMMKWFTRVEGSAGTGDAAKTDVEWAAQNTLQQLRDEEQKALDDYEWVDRSAGIARIPVDRAMEIISQNGLPTQIQGPSAGGSNPIQQSTDAAAIQPETPEPDGR